jgi:hypothetical protein
MNINITVPTSYGKMTEKQTRYMINLLVEGLSQEAIWAKCFFRFSGLKLKAITEDACFVKYKKSLLEVHTEEMDYMIRKMEFLTKKYSGLQPPTKLKGFIPAESLFENVIFGQYLEMENEYQAYVFTQKKEHLNNMIAILYGKCGAKYDNNRIEKRAKKLKRCTKTDKLQVFMWVLSVKEFFTQKYRLLFAPETQDENEQKQAPDMYVIIQNQVRALTDGDITKRESVLNSLTWDALDELNNKIREAKKLERNT